MTDEEITRARAEDLRVVLNAVDALATRIGLLEAQAQTIIDFALDRFGEPGSVDEPVVRCSPCGAQLGSWTLGP